MSEEKKIENISNESLEDVNGGVVIPNGDGGYTVTSGNDINPFNWGEGKSDKLKDIFGVQ